MKLKEAAAFLVLSMRTKTLSLDRYSVFEKREPIIQKQNAADSDGTIEKEM